MEPFVPREHPFIILASAFFGMVLGLIAARLLIRVRPIRATLDRMSHKIAQWIIAGRTSRSRTGACASGTSVKPNRTEGK